MPQKRITISQFNLGLKQTPASSQKGWLGASDMQNLEVDENGYLQIAGHLELSDIPLEGIGDNLSIFHWPGIPRKNDPVTKYYRTDDSAMAIGRRAFFADSSGRPKWRDLATNEEYDWQIEPPSEAPTTRKTNAFAVAGEADVYNKISNVQVIPNPFTDRGIVLFEVVSNINLRVTIFDFNNDLVAYLNPNDDLDNDAFVQYTPGVHPLTWNARDQNNKPISRGVYFIKIETGDANNPISIGSTRAGFLGFSDTGDEPRQQEIRAPFVDEGDLVEGIGFRGGNYLICYTYANLELGIETPPSPIGKVKVIAFQVEGQQANPKSFDRAPYWLELSNYLDDVPPWANHIKFYVKKGQVPDDVVKVKDTPYSNNFAYVGGPVRASLRDAFEAYWIFSNEHVAPQHQFLPFVDENDPPINDASNLVVYSARTWFWDKADQSIRFSLIDGSGVSRWDIFPYQGAPIPHAIRFEGASQGNATGIHIMPGSGGLYVFFQDSIGVIRGKGLIGGMYSADLSPITDLDASGGLRGVGSSSPRGITDNGSTTYFVGSDYKIHALAGSKTLTTTDISIDIQEFLKQASEEELRDAVLTYYDRNLHLFIAGKCLIYDLQRKYWKKFNWDMSDAIWAPGGDLTDSTFFGLKGARLHHLYKGDTNQLEWYYTSNDIIVPDRTRLVAIYCEYSGAPKTIQIKIDADDKVGTWMSFTPMRGNKFRFGTFARLHSKFKVSIKGVGQPPPIYKLEAGLI